jgi:predicted TIM-barrel fold metal-dependent hydrolase
MSTVIDCHYHLDERYLTVDQMIARMDAAGIGRVALMAPMTEPIPETPRPLVRLLQFLLAHRATRPLGRRSIERFDAEGGVEILGKLHLMYPHPDNAPVFDLVGRMPDRFLGWVFVRPGSALDPAAELEKWISRPGLVGVKAHPFWHRFEPVRLLSVTETLIAVSKPLLIHAGFGRHGDFLPLLEKAPGLKLIIAHAGFPDYTDTLRKIKDRKNVYVDLSQTSYVNVGATRRAVEVLGVERCLYGTDGPYGYQAADGKFDFGFIKARLERLFPDAGARQRLLGGNLAELAGIK